MTLDPQLARLYASRPDGQMPVAGISLSHPGFSRSWHLTDWPRQWAGGDSSGGTIIYQPAPFAFQALDQDQSGRGNGQIRLPATAEVCAEVAAAARRSNDPMTLVSRIYIATAPAIIPNGTPRMVLTVQLTGLEIDLDAGVISGMAAMPRLDGMAVPRLTYRGQFPGLDRA